MKSTQYTEIWDCQKMKEYETLSKVLEDIVQEIQERNIHEDHNLHMSGEMSIN